jgi:hypothetical protein
MIRRSNMSTSMRDYVKTCPHCKGKLNDWFRGNFKGRYLNNKFNTFKPRYFCTEECYKDYTTNFIVETYNNEPIYCVEIDGVKRYMPYFEANYYFTNIDDCKKRMDMKNVTVVNLNMWGLLK